MELKIDIDLSSWSCDIEIKSHSLCHAKNLSAISEAVAEQLKSALRLEGLSEEVAERAKNLLLRGNYDIEYILKAASRDCETYLD